MSIPMAISTTQTMNYNRIRTNRSGFTLIELLVVITIIGVIASVVLASLNVARAKGRDGKRISDLKQMQIAVELYYDEHGSYPDTGGNWRGGTTSCYGGLGHGASGFIPGVVPDFIPRLPEDPQAASPNRCYLYRSNGTDYMILVHLTIETFDPDTGPHPLDRSCCNQQSIAVYSEGASGW